MTVYSKMFSPLPALLLYCLIGIPGDAAYAHSGVISFTHSPESAWRTPLNQRTGVWLQQSRQEKPTTKRKSLNEYSPEDVLPEALEAENPRPNSGQVSLKKEKIKRTPAAVPMVTPTPTLETSALPAVATGPTITPTPTLEGSAAVPTVTPEPTPETSALPAAVITASPTPAVITLPATMQQSSSPQETERHRAIQWKLFVRITLFLLAFVNLVFFLTKLIQLRRSANKSGADITSREHHSATRMQLLSSEREATAEK